MIHIPTEEEIAEAVSRPADVARILELHPSVRARATEHLEESRTSQVPFIIVCGYRSPSGQRMEYAKGRRIIGSDPRAWPLMSPDGRGVVTRALPWRSWHQYRLAYDIALLKPDGKAVHWNEVADLDEDGVADWLEVVRIGESLELSAGYRWPSRKHDGAHFEFHPGLELNEAWGMCVTGKSIPDDHFEKVA
jgi:hypothetical protein